MDGEKENGEERNQLKQKSTLMRVEIQLHLEAYIKEIRNDKRTTIQEKKNFVEFIIF